MKIYKISIIFIILLVFVSCGIKSNQEDHKDQFLIETTDTILSLDIPFDTLEFLRNFKTQQLGERKFVLQPGDTVEFGKPVLKLFTGQVEGKAVQFWLIDGSETLPSFNWYMEGNGDLNNYSLLNAFDNSIFYTLVDDDTLKIDRKIHNGKLTIIFKNNKYLIQENYLHFAAYQCFEYYNTVCPEYVKLMSHQFFSFDYALDKNTSDNNDQVYKTLNEIIEDNSNPKVKNTYKVIPEALDSLLDQDPRFSYSDICLRWGFYTYNIPLYIDSLLFVTCTYMMEDNGGVHGWYSTSYENYDIKDQSFIAFEDVIDEYHPAYIKYLRRVIQENGYDTDLDNKEIRSFSSFYIIPNGIKIIYPIYFLGGGFWEKEVFLPYDEIKPFLKTDKYFSK